MKTRKRILILALAGTLLFGTVAISMGSILGDLLKVGGVSLVINQFGDQMNDALNKLTMNKGVGIEDRTKVVPILSIGKGSYIGAAQVSGPAHLVDRVKAVAQLETGFSGKTIRMKALVPIESEKVVQDLKRVSGVGVSAIIDIKL